MTQQENRLDREQLRHNATHPINSGVSWVDYAPSPEEVLALLAELEQAEEPWKSVVDEQSRKIIGLNMELGAAEARLAKVPPLVEALREVVHDAALASDSFWLERVCVALAALESE